MSEPSCHTTKFFMENAAIEMKKNLKYLWIKLYLGHSILELSKVLMFEFWYDYLNPKPWKSEIVLYQYS